MKGKYNILRKPDGNIPSYASTNEKRNINTVNDFRKKRHRPIDLLVICQKVHETRALLNIRRIKSRQVHGSHYSELSSDRYAVSAVYSNGIYLLLMHIVNSTSLTCYTEFLLRLQHARMHARVNIACIHTHFGSDPYENYSVN